jgi:hypothetical protein
MTTTAAIVVLSCRPIVTPIGIDSEAGHKPRPTRLA